MRETYAEVTFNAVPARAGEPVFVIHGWQVTPALAIHRVGSMWAVSSINGLRMIAGILRRKAAVEVARAIEQVALAHGIPLAGNHEEWKALPAWEQFMSDMGSIKRVRNSGEHDVTLNGVLDDYPGSEVINHYVRWHDYDPVKYAEGEKGHDGSAWTDVSKEWIEDALDSLEKGEALVFAWTEYDQNHDYFEDAIHAWLVEDDRRMGRVESFLNAYRQDLPAIRVWTKKLVAILGSDEAADRVLEMAREISWGGFNRTKLANAILEAGLLRDDRPKFETLTDMPREAMEAALYANSILNRRDENESARELMREIMREDGWGVLFVDGDKSNVFERRTQIVEQLRLAVDYVHDVRNDMVYAVGVTVKRVWRNWYGQLEEAQDVSTTYNSKGVASDYVMDSLWGIEMGRGQDDAYLGEVMDEMTPDSALPASPEDAYFSTFAG